MGTSTAKTSVRGTLWSMIERVSTMGVQLLCTLAIAQYLPPSEFGLVGMMTIFIAFSLILVDSGFGQAIIREQNVSQNDYSSIFFFNIGLGGAAYLLMFVCAPLIAAFYAEPQLTVLLRVDFIAVVCQAFCVVQMAQLYKSVNFARVSKVSLISVVLSGIIGIVTAVIRHDVWALIAQNVSYAFIRSVLFWLFSSWRPSMEFRWTNIRKYLRFSMNLLASRLIAALTDNAPNLFIGKSFTAADLGNYTVPNKLQTSVAGTISFAIHRVSYPVMATFQNDLEHLRSYSQNVVGMAFYIIAPIMVLMMIESRDLFTVILSDEWLMAAEYFRYLCVIGALFCFADINMDILLVRNKADLVLKIEIVRKTLFVAALVVGIMFDMQTLLVLLVAWNLLNALFVSFFSGREIDCPLTQQLRNIGNTLFCLLLTGSATLLCSKVLPLGALGKLVVCCLVGATVYLLASYLLHNRNLQFLREHVLQPTLTKNDAS